MYPVVDGNKATQFIQYDLPDALTSKLQHEKHVCKLRSWLIH